MVCCLLNFRTPLSVKGINGVSQCHTIKHPIVINKKNKKRTAISNFFIIIAYCNKTLSIIEKINNAIPCFQKYSTDTFPLQSKLLQITNLAGFNLNFCDIVIPGFLQCGQRYIYFSSRRINFSISSHIEAALAISPRA
jgi:hypothetical protein